MKTIREVIKKDLEIINLDKNIVLDMTLWRKLNHVVVPISERKICFCCKFEWPGSITS